MGLTRIIFLSIFCFSTAALSYPSRLDLSELNGIKPLNEENTLSNFSGKKEKLLYFWATWCDVCKSKLTTVFKKDSLYSKYDVYLVATDQDLKKVEHLQKKLDLKKYVVVDSDRKLQNKFEIYGVPTVIRLAPEGEQFVVKAFQTGGEIEALIQ